MKLTAGLAESEGEWLSEESGWTPMARVMRADDSTKPITACATYVQADGGKMVLTASEDGLLRVWSAASGECERRLVGHAGAVLSCCAFPWLGGVGALSAGADGQLMLWGLEACSGAQFGTMQLKCTVIKCEDLSHADAATQNDVYVELHAYDL